MMMWLERILDKSVPLSTFKADARSWQTCAVGEARQQMPNTVLYKPAFSGALFDEPVDKRLYKLGCDFDKAVAAGKRSQALQIYFQIQRRIATLAGVRPR